MADNNNQQLHINLKLEVGGGIYSILVILTHSSSEFVAVFMQMMPGMPKAQVRSRIIMAPEHAKRLLMALQDNVRKYEQQFGAIRLTQAQQEEGRTIAPFSIKQGEA